MKNICTFVKNLLISSLIVFATLCSTFAITTAIALNLSGNNFTAYAEEVPTISAGDFKTTGASVRVFKITTDADGNKTYQETNRTGIRFHVGMSADYISLADGYLNLFDVNSDARNENGSYVISEGYKTYTLIIPTRKLGNSDLTATFDGVLQIDTTNYWFNDGKGNLESVAYVYDVPEHRLNDEFAFRGIVCSVDENGNETPVAWTDIGTRSLAYVAKRAYTDTNDDSYDYWGTSDNDAFAAPIIKQFIPTYQLTIKTYNADGSFTESVSQEILWGDMPSDYLTVVEGDKWYHENNHEEINLNTPFDLPHGSTITAVSSNHSYFVFTGVEYTETGFSVSATLPTQFFKDGTEIESSAIDMVTNSGNHISATKAVINVTGTGNDATTKLAITFDYTNIEDQTTLTILKSSNFYYNGVLYQLEADYDFIYENKKWQLPLGQITVADIQAENGIIDYQEGTPVENTIRITFDRDILINGSVTFEGDVYVTREGTNEKISITSGHYFWNQGSNKILEIPGELDTTIINNLKGINDGDTLTITAGTKLIQNNGYYVFPNDIVATFNGESVWEFSFDTHEITASEFTAAYTRREGDSIYIDVYTSQRWANKMVKVVLNDGTLTYNNTDNTTSIDPKKIFYHGEDNHQILRIYIDKWSETGDWVTIPSGTKFYVGNQIYHLTESVISYFVETSDDGMSWITNPNIQEISLNNITSMGWYQGNVRYTTDTIWSEAPNNFIIVDDTFIEGDGISISGSPYTGLYYYGATNSILELQGTNFGVGGGAVTLKKGTILWLFNNVDRTPSGAYVLKDDLSVEIGGGSNSIIYKNTEVATISKNEIVAIYNDGSHAGETRFELNRDKIPNTYGEASVDGVATLNGEATTSAFVYGGDGTSGYAGNPIIALTGNSFGRPFQATEKGDKIIIEQGTKIWLSNGSGYVTFAEDWIYVYNGNSYSDWSIMRNVNFSGANATVKIDGLTLTNTMINTGEKLTFTVEIPAGYEIASVSNATLVSHNGNVYTYVTDYIFGDLSVAINVTEPIVINSNSITSAYFEAGNEIRLALDKANIPALNDITGGNYNITFIGETVLTINGVSATPTQYNYFGLIGEANHQLLGIQLNAPMTLGDQLTIKGGSKFKFGATILYVEEDITITTVVANFDESLATLALDGIGINNGVAALKVITGKESTLTFGWKDESYSATYGLSVKINGEEQGKSGTYTFIVNESIGIDIEFIPHADFYAVTWEEPSNATIDVTAYGKPINNGETFVENTSISVNVTANEGYVVTNVTANGTSIGTNSGTYTVNSATTIVATVKKLYTVSATTNGGVTVTPSSKVVIEGESVTFTLSNVPANATIKANGTVVNENTYTINNVTADTPVTFTTWYNVTVNAGNATVSGDTNGLYQVDDTFDFTVADTVSHKVTNVTVGSSIGTAAGSYSHKVTGATVISVATVEKAKYTVSWDNLPDGASVTVTANETGNVTNGGTVYAGQTLTVTVTASNDFRLNTVTIGGQAQSGVSTTRNDSSTFNYTVNADTTISATTVKMYQVSWSSGNFSITGGTNGGWYDNNTNLSLTITPSANYAITSITANGGNNLGSSSYMTAAEPVSVAISANTTIAVTAEAYPTITINANGAKVTLNNTEYTDNNKTVKLPKGTYSVTIADVAKTTLSAGYTVNSVSITGVTTNGKGTYSVPVQSNITIDVTTTKVDADICIVEGTMILLADGSQKPVEDLVVGDMLLVFNHYTGEYDARPLVINAHADEDAKLYKILNVNFSNGSQWRIAGTHGIFDTTLNEYVMISAENINEFVGHQFYYTDGLNGETVTLINYYVTEEVVKIYSPATLDFANYFANGLLNAPPFPDTYTAGQMNYFDFDENMIYVNVEEDIETYGLYTYADFEGLITEEVFNALPFKYFKISVEKGIMTWDDILAVIDML